MFATIEERLHFNVAENTDGRPLGPIPLQLYESPPAFVTTRRLNTCWDTISKKCAGLPLCNRLTAFRLLSAMAARRLFVEMTMEN